MPAPGTVLAALPTLRAVIRNALDIGNLDVQAAEDVGILVIRGTPGWIDSVCELIFGATISLLRSIPDAAAAYRSGAAPELRMGRQLAGSTMGVIGFGHLGRRVAELALCLRMNVLVSDPYTSGVPEKVELVEFNELLVRSDFVVCVAALTTETTRMFNRSAFAAMRPNAIFVNASRGALVDEKALEEALGSSKLGGAVLDVGTDDDDRPSPRLASLPNVVATPHLGGLVPEAVAHHAHEVCDQVEAILAGRQPIGALNWSSARRIQEWP